MIRNELTNRQKALPRFLLNQLRGQTLKRSVNWFKYDWNVLESKERNFTAPVLVATITDACNLRCPSCLYLLEDKKFLKKNFMEILDFKEIVDRYYVEAEILFLSGGEPLLHPDFWKFVAIGKEKGLKVKISTNGIHIADNVLNKWAIRYQLDEINVSVDCWDYESFKKYRGGNVDQYMNILDGLGYLKDNKPNFSLSFLLSRENAKYADKMLNFASIYKPATVHFHNINPHGCNEYKPLTLFCMEMTNIIDIEVKNNYPFDIVISHIFDEESEKFRTKGCVQPWYYLCWNHKGDIAPCCHLAHNEKYGNILDGEEGLDVFRQMMIMNDGLGLPDSCKYCQRRFLGDNYAVFKKKKERWYK